MTEIMHEQYAPSGDHAPNGQHAPGQPVTAPDGPPDWERKRYEQLDELDELGGAAIPFGPARSMAVYPTVASAMLSEFYRRDRRAFIELRDECEADAPLPEVPKRTRNRSR